MGQFKSTDAWERRLDPATVRLLALARLPESGVTARFKHTSLLICALYDRDSRPTASADPLGYFCWIYLSQARQESSVSVNAFFRDRKAEFSGDSEYISAEGIAGLVLKADEPIPGRLLQADKRSACFVVKSPGREELTTTMAQHGWKDARVNFLIPPAVVSKTPVGASLVKTPLDPTVNPQGDDLYVIHSSADKDFVRDLVFNLKTRSLSVWFDEATLKVGDSLRRGLDKGILSCRFAIVVVSEDLFRTSWAQSEIDAFAALGNRIGRQMLLPVLHGIQHSDLVQLSPILAGLVTCESAQGIDSVVDHICGVVSQRPPA